MSKSRERAESIVASLREIFQLLAHRRNTGLMVIAVALFASAFSWRLLPKDVVALAKPPSDTIITLVLLFAGVVPFCIAVWRIWRETRPPNLPPEGERPDAIKGPMAFTPEDGKLFRRLGREAELTRLLGYVQDDQISLVVVMGESGAGKTSLLRAGLSNVAQDKEIAYHYCEVTPKDPEVSLLEAIRTAWEDPDVPPPESLDDLTDAARTGSKRRVIVLDQFEQLGGRDVAACPIFGLLRQVIREAKPPHHITWVVAFRREFRAEWSDFIIPEQEHGFHHQEMSLRLFSRAQAQDAVSVLVAEAKLNVQQRVIDKLLDAAIVEGRVSPVDIGIGMLVLSELAEQHGSEMLTARDFQMAGGSEGLLTEYVRKKLDFFGDRDSERLLLALLALCDLDTNQRVAEGKTVEQLSKAAGGGVTRLEPQLRHLASRSVRLLEDQQKPYYRLPHDRMVPALRRLTGLFLAKEQKARMTFETAHKAWTANDKRSQYLLRGADLRLVLRHIDTIDQKGAPGFLAKSRHQRDRWRIVLSVAAAILLVISGTMAWNIREAAHRNEMQIILERNGYPRDLYDWQDNLVSLHLVSEFNLDELSWLESDTLQELTLTPVSRQQSLDGIASLRRLSSLRSLTSTFAVSKPCASKGL